MIEREAAEEARDQSIAEVAEYSWLANFRRVRVLFYDRAQSGGSVSMSHLWSDYQQMLHAYVEEDHIVLDKVGVWSGTVKISVMTTTSKFLISRRNWQLGTDGQEGFQMDFGSETWQRILIEVHPAFLNAEDRSFFQDKATIFRPLM